MKCNEKCCDDDVLFFKQKTAYEMRIGYWSSDVCSADLRSRAAALGGFSRAGRSAQDCVQPPRRPAGQGAAVLNADPLPIGERVGRGGSAFEAKPPPPRTRAGDAFHPDACGTTALVNSPGWKAERRQIHPPGPAREFQDRKSTRLNSSP